MKKIFNGKTGAAMAILLLIFTAAGGVSAQDADQAAPREDAEIGTIHPSPQNVRESVDTYVFLGWIWAVIFLLLFVLRHKIKEVDRLHEIMYFSVKGKQDY